MPMIRRAVDTTPEYFEGIQAQRFKYYADTFKGYPLPDITALVEETDLKKWRNPNYAVGTSSTRAGQRFSQPRIALAEGGPDEWSLGFAYFADNASSERSGLSGRLEQEFKLHAPIDKAVSHRFRVIRELITDRTDIASILIDAAFADTEGQPKSTYVFSGEDLVIAALQEHGFVANEAFNREQAGLRPRLGPTPDLPPVFTQRYDHPANG